MFTALLQMALLIACGSLWKAKAPNHIPVMAHRRALTDLVFYILLPAMVLDVIWQTDLNISSVRISFLAVTGLATGLLLMWSVLHFYQTENRQKGALLLAASFPNATYLGLPVLDQIIGPETRSTVIQYDLFACTPILLSFGMLLARYYGNNQSEIHPLKEILKVPPLWAVAIGVSLNSAGVTQPEILHMALSTLAGGVVPLMLIVLGMSIRWQSLHLRFYPLLLPVVLSSLLVVPTVVLAMSHLIGLSDLLRTEVVIIAAMPTMIFGVVISERYGLDSELYAAAVTLTTVSSLLTVPLWFQWLSS
jgi:predicted permease